MLLNRGMTRPGCHKVLVERSVRRTLDETQILHRYRDSASFRGRTDHELGSSNICVTDAKYSMLEALTRNYTIDTYRGHDAAITNVKTTLKRGEATDIEPRECSKTRRRPARRTEHARQ